MHMHIVFTGIIEFITSNDVNSTKMVNVDYHHSCYLFLKLFFFTELLNLNIFFFFFLDIKTKFAVLGLFRKYSSL